MKSLVILGAGTGGTMMAARLRKRLPASEWSITVADRDNVHVYQPGLLFVPFGMYREGGNVEFVVMHVRQGKLMGTQRHSEKGMEHPDAEVLAGFLGAYYDDAPLIPDELLLPFALVAAPSALIPAAAAAGLSFATRLLVAIRFRQSASGVLLHPLSVATVLAVQWSALVRGLLGRPVAWKGRAAT